MPQPTIVVPARESGASGLPRIDAGLCVQIFRLDDVPHQVVSIASLVILIEFILIDL